MAMPKDDKTRKEIRIFDGFVKYFPDAIAACAQLSVIANEKHNPGEPLHWAKGKSTEQRNSMMRHLVDEASDSPLSRDPENGVLHAVQAMWRACAQVQTLADQGHDIFAVPPDAVAYAGEQCDNSKAHPFDKFLQPVPRSYLYNSIYDAQPEPPYDPPCFTPGELGMQRDPIMMDGPFKPVWTPGEN